MKKILLLLILFIGTFGFSKVSDDFNKINKNQFIGNKIEIQNNSYQNVECLVVNGLDEIISRVKVGSLKVVTIDIGVEIESYVRVFYKTSLDIDWYQAGQINSSYPPRFIIEDDY